MNIYYNRDFFLFTVIYISIIRISLFFSVKKYLVQILTIILSLFYIFFLNEAFLPLLICIGYQVVLVKLLTKLFDKNNLLSFLLILAPIFLKGVLENQYDIIFWGMSYMCFKSITMYLDPNIRSYKLREYILHSFSYLLFYPTLLIGPIDHFSRFIMNVQDWEKNVDGSFEKGLKSLLIGISFLFLIVPFLESKIQIAESVLGNTRYGLFYFYMVGIIFVLKFSGLSHIAVGVSTLTGIMTPHNFNNPFLAINQEDFWKRFHITFSDWLKNYIFFPLLKYLVDFPFFRKRLFNAKMIALMVTFLFMSLWNGVTVDYLMSGFLFGLYSVIYNIYKRKVSHRMSRVVATLLTLHVNLFAIYVLCGGLT